MTTKRKQKLALIARKAANVMARKTSWCQGSWAETKNGDAPSCELRADGEYTAAAKRTSALQNAARNSYIDSDFFEANSPAAQKFCVEGAIYKAAGKVSGLGVRGYNDAIEVIGLLDSTVEASEHKFTSGQGLNDYNGDASRQTLVTMLRGVAKELTA